MTQSEKQEKTRNFWKSHNAEKTSETFRVVWLVTIKALNTMVTKGGTLWKQQRLLAIKVGKPREIL